MAESAGTPGWADDPDRFGSALEELKASGCLLLVVESDDAASACGCDRMLGTDGHADRRRLFVRGDTTAHRRSSVRTPERDDERTVAYRTGARTATAAATDSDLGTVERPDATASDPTKLASTIESQVDVLRPPSGFAPGQLRVCVDVVADIVAIDDLASAAAVVERLGDVVRAADGMAHVHVGDAVPARAVEGLHTQFDAVVELEGDDEPRQRWHLPDESLSTAWLEL